MEGHEEQHASATAGDIGTRRHSTRGHIRQLLQTGLSATHATELLRLVLQARPVGLRVAKTAFAAAVAWELARDLLPGPMPVLAPLAAILTVQVTVYDSLSGGIRYAIAMLAGMAVSLAFAQVLGFSAWTLGLMVLLALAMGNVLRLGPQSNQVAITALLVLSLGTGYGVVRALDTALGIAVGVLVNLVVVPPLHLMSASEAIGREAEHAGDLLAEMGRGLAGGWTGEQARGWLDRARGLDPEVRTAHAAVARAEDSLRLNPRRWLTRRGGPNEMVARQHEALLAVEHTTIQVRSIARTLVELADEEPAGLGGKGFALPDSLAALLGHGGEALREFGRLVARGAADLDEKARGALPAAVANAWDARLRALEDVRKLLAGEPQLMPACGSLLADVSRLIREVDPTQGFHRSAIGQPR